MTNRALFAIVLLPCAAIAKTPEYLELVESPVFETPGTQQEITKRGLTCITQIVRNDEFKMRDATGPMVGGFSMTRKSSAAAPSQVILNADENTGTIVANSRVTYPGGITGASNTRTTLTFLAKEGRFKIQHTNIETASESTGYLANPGYTKQGKWRFSQWEKADAALQSLSTKIAECVMKSTTSGDW